MQTRFIIAEAGEECPQLPQDLFRIKNVIVNFLHDQTPVQAFSRAFNALNFFYPLG